MAQHDFTPAWLNFPTAPSSSKVPGSPAECLDNHRDVSRRRRHNSSDGSESVGGCAGGTELRHSKHPPNPQSRTSRMTVIKRVSREEPPTTPPSPATPQQQHASSHNGAGPSVYKGPVLKPVSLPVKASRSSSLSPVDKGSPPRLMMRLTRMRSDRKSHFLKALKRDAVDEEDLHHHCKDEDGFHLQNSIMGCRDENLNRYECTVSQENSNTNALLRSSTFPQQEVLSSSLEAEHRLLKEMGWQEESENDDTCAPLTEDEMREFQAISEQLRKNGLRRNGLPKNGPPVDSLAVWKTGHLGMTAGAAEETETSSSDTSDDDA
uniref:Vasculin n=1 Tax=Esox lucius TaxID=8010 RepID=A0AAY5KHE1_ESOLU